MEKWMMFILAMVGAVVSLFSNQENTDTIRIIASVYFTGWLICNYIDKKVDA